MCTDNSQRTTRLEELITRIKEKREVLELVYDWAERSGIDVDKDECVRIEDAKISMREVEDGYLRELQDRLQDLLDDIDEYQKIAKEMSAQEDTNTGDSAYVLALQEKTRKYAEVLQSVSYFCEIFYMEVVYGPSPVFDDMFGELDAGSSPFS